jgi:hypothetical protein
MGKKQRLRKQQKLANKPRGSAPPDWFSEGVSPEAQKVMEKLARINPATDEALFMRAMMDAESLRSEPELQDFHLPSDEVGRAVNRFLPKYEPLLERAKQRGEEEFQTTYDDLRIEALELVLTRERRQDFLKRYDALLRRLMKGQDAKKLEQALIVRTLLDEKTLPWGANALVTSIFEEAKEEALERYEKANDLLRQLVKQENPEATDQELLELLEDPERIRELSDSLDIPPSMMEQLQEMTGDVLAEFESALYAGEFELDLFMAEELEQVVEQINMFTAKERPDRSTEMSPETAQRLAHILAQFVGEIMTEQRIAQMERDLDVIEREWFAKGITEATLLRMERDDLREIEPVENRFLFGVLVGQIRRASDEQEDNQTDDGSLPADKSSPNVASFRSRTGNLFKRGESQST